MPTTLCTDGKQPGWASVKAIASSSKEGLFIVQDKFLGGQFLVDTGAEVSIFLSTRTITRTTQPAGSLLVMPIVAQWEMHHPGAFCIEAVQVGFHHR